MSCREHQLSLALETVKRNSVAFVRSDKIEGAFFVDRIELFGSIAWIGFLQDRKLVYGVLAIERLNGWL